ncbi:MAG: DUF4388 domain-containing protein, partial [Acidobacteriota bacterium]|nr:DUF4388 domain-containing protein [Acidobacteriota bacterium]
MPLTGHLSDLSLSELIEFFCNQRKTGQLKVLYPQGRGYFYLQAGSVVDARIGVLRGIEAVYFALTLPNANFEFGDSKEPVERTINQPWAQVVLEGLRRLDEGVVPPTAFPQDYSNESTVREASPPPAASTEPEKMRPTPTFLSTNHAESSKRKIFIAGATALAVIGSVAAIGVPAGWYGRTKTAAAVASQPEIQSASTTSTTADASSTVDEAPSNDLVGPSGPSDPSDPSNDAVLVAKRQRDKEKAKARAENGTLNQPAARLSSPTSTNGGTESAKSGPKKVSVTVTYDESGRVTQASGGDATALRIARQK